jgi:hypothetical protein
MTQQPMKKPRLAPEAVAAAPKAECATCAALRTKITVLEAMLDERDRAIQSLRRQ